MNVLDLDPPISGKALFKRSLVEKIPEQMGVYSLTDFEGAILYIGLSKNLRKRFEQHLDDPQKTSPTTEGKSFWFYYLVSHSENIEILERSWLNEYEVVHGKKPILNSISSPIS